MKNTPRPSRADGEQARPLAATLLGYLSGSDGDWLTARFQLKVMLMSCADCQRSSGFLASASGSGGPVLRATRLKGGNGFGFDVRIAAIRLAWRLRAEGRLARCHLVQHGPEGKDVGSRCQPLFPPAVLVTCIGRSRLPCPRLSAPLTWLARPDLQRRRLPLRRFAKPKSNSFGSGLGQHDVPRL